jgi:hypothetical protein
MTATFGLSGAVSLRSAALQELLESKLRRKTAKYGSILYRLTWKHWELPSGRRICALRASAARISVKGNILLGWPTPNASDMKWRYSTLEAAERRSSSGKQISMECSAHLAGWPTATTRDWKDGQECSNVEINCLLGREVWMTGWATPCSMETEQSPETTISRKKRLSETTGIHRGPALPVSQQVQLAGWNTPTCPTKGEDGHQAGNNHYTSSVTSATRHLQYAIRGKLCPNTGMMLIGSYVEILPESQAGGPLDPEHSRWLMGLPREWANCAPTEMRSISKRRKASAKSSSKSALAFDL